MILWPWFSQADNSTSSSRMLQDYWLIWFSIVISQTVKCFSPHSDFNTSLLAPGRCSPHFSIDRFMCKSSDLIIFTKSTLTLNYFAFSSNETITYHQDSNVMDRIMEDMNTTFKSNEKVSWFFWLNVHNKSESRCHSTYRMVFTYVLTTCALYMQHSLKTAK